MTEFEKKILADLQAGRTPADILNAFQTHLDTAVTEAKRLEEEKHAAEQAELARNQAMLDIANRYAERATTADDVAWLMTEYAIAKYGLTPDEAKNFITGKDLDMILKMTIDAMRAMLGPLEELARSIEEKSKNKDSEIKPKVDLRPAMPINAMAQTDDEALRSFLDSLLK
jgi:7-cyano-7-deazaguanine synthase in queuosine biosynthesis